MVIDVFFSEISLKILLSKSTRVVLYARNPNNLNLFKVSINVIVLGGRFKKKVRRDNCLLKKYIMTKIIRTM